MFSIKNKEVKFQFIKDGKMVGEKVFVNSLTPIYFDAILHDILPRSIGAVLFPDFTSLPFVNKEILMSTVRLNDTSFADSSEITTSDDIWGNKGKTITSIYSDVTATSINKLYFGLEDGALPDEDYFSLIDFGAITLDIPFGFQLIISRVDEITTNETAKALWIDGVLQNFVDYRYLPSNSLIKETQTNLNKIYLCGEEAGGNICNEFNVADLTFTNLGNGQVKISGFGDFYFEEEVLYPSDDLFPEDDLYPTQSFNQVKSVVFEYDGTIKEDLVATPYKVQTYIDIKDLNPTYDGGEITIRLTCESSASLG